ncbi:Carcinoembryonic antigen-related cell adhesion molecule 6 [Formica fusca]
MRPAAGHWRKILLVYILQLFPYTTLADHMRVQLIAPKYITYGETATFFCNHTVRDDLLHKIEFMKDDKRIFQYIKERKPPYIISPHIDGAKRLEYSENGTTIKLYDVHFEASGSYTCEVAMTTPIYTAGADPVDMKVIHPQSANPKITFQKSMYVVGESLEANCTSSAAYPVPYITWFINGKEVDITLVNHYPHTYHKDYLMSATARLKVEVSALHAGENGRLEISCRATIPDFPMQHEKFADIKTKTVSVQIIPAPDMTSSAAILVRELTLSTILCILNAMHEFIP